MTSTERPDGLGASGIAIWDALTALADLDPWETVMLHEACRVADRLDTLDAAQRAESLTVTNHKGDQVASPYLVEARLQAAIYTRLVASLRIPDTSTGAVPQRRGAARGNYSPRTLRSAS